MVRYYFGTDTTLVITPEGGSAIGLACLQSASVISKRTINTLRGCGSTKIQKRAQDEYEVEVKFKVAGDDHELVGEILGSWTSGTGTATLTDSTTPTEFTVVITGTSRTTGKTLACTITNVVFAEAPSIEAGYNEWDMWEYTGTGDLTSDVETP